MSRLRIAVGAIGVVLVGTIAFSGYPTLLAQSPALPRAETGDAAVSALVAELRGLRADLAAASRNQLRAQLLLGRVQMQEQRLAYLDKQRADTVTALTVLSQMTSAMRSGFGGGDASACASMPSPEARRDCEVNMTMRKQQLADQEAREQQLRNQESELANALSAEQARWSDFNGRLDELEQGIR